MLPWPKNHHLIGLTTTSHPQSLADHSPTILLAYHPYIVLVRYPSNRYWPFSLVRVLALDKYWWTKRDSGCWLLLTVHHHSSIKADVMQGPSQLSPLQKFTPLSLIRSHQLSECDKKHIFTGKSPTLQHPRKKTFASPSFWKQNPTDLQRSDLFFSGHQRCGGSALLQAGQPFFVVGDVCAMTVWFWMVFRCLQLRWQGKLCIALHCIALHVGFGA